MDEQTQREIIEDWRAYLALKPFDELEPTFQELRDWNKFQARRSHADRA